MGNETELANALSRGIKNTMKYSLIVDGIITDTSEAETNFTVSVQLLSDGQPIYFNVPLRVIVNTQGSYVEIPEVSSPCLLCFRDGSAGRPQILFVDKILKLLVNCGTVMFNGGELGGMAKVIDLTSKLNNLENLVNDLIVKYNAHTHTGVTTGPGSSGPTVAQETETLTLTVRTDIEDTKILH